MGKVVKGGPMFFKDDIAIDEGVIAARIALPTVPILSQDELMIFYNGHIYTIGGLPTKEAEAKFYTMRFGLQQADSAQEQEEQYFRDNEAVFSKIRRDFIDNVVSGVSGLADSHPLKQAGSSHLADQLVQKINDNYKLPDLAYKQPPGAGHIPRLEGDSVFSLIPDMERRLIVDNKMYNLLTMPETIDLCPDKAFKRGFKNRLKKMALSSTPEQVHDFINANSESLHYKARDTLRNKIWHSDRSDSLLMDGTYWIPDYHNVIDETISLYELLLEREVKIRAVNEMKGGGNGR